MLQLLKSPGTATEVGTHTHTLAKGNPVDAMALTVSAQFLTLIWSLALCVSLLDPSCLGSALSHGNGAVKSKQVFLKGGGGHSLKSSLDHRSV